MKFKNEKRAFKFELRSKQNQKRRKFRNFDCGFEIVDSVLNSSR